MIGEFVTFMGMRIDLMQDELPIKFVPDGDGLSKCYEFGLRAAEKVKILCSGG